MNATEIAHALGDARREGRGWRCRCPLHGGRSLVLRDGDGGRVLATCWGGCDRLDVLAELRRLGQLDGRGSDYRPNVTAASRRDDTACDASHTARALAIWREAQPIIGTLAERYLLGRGIVIAELQTEMNASLRFHPRCPHPGGTKLPAMVALVERVGAGTVAIHRTFLRADGSGKANIEPDKASLAPVGGGAVRFGMPRAGEWLAIGEGLETSLSVAVASAMPAWAALSAGGIRALVLPREGTQVVICADNDASGVGERAARDAAARWLAEGRRVKIAMPPEPGTDFADILTADAATNMEEAHHVA
jgi:putative DNA primase/helicase